MSDEKPSRFRAFLDYMNSEYDGFAPPPIQWFLLVSVLGMTSCTVTTAVGYFAFNLPSQPAVIACQAKGMDAARPDFSRQVTCLPRYRGADSLNATVESK